MRRMGEGGLASNLALGGVGFSSSKMSQDERKETERIASLSSGGESIP